MAEASKKVFLRKAHVSSYRFRKILLTSDAVFADQTFTRVVEASRRWPSATTRIPTSRPVRILRISRRCCRRAGKECWILTLPETPGALRRKPAVFERVRNADRRARHHLDAGAEQSARDARDGARRGRRPRGRQRMVARGRKFVLARIARDRRVPVRLRCGHYYCGQLDGWRRGDVRLRRRRDPREKNGARGPRHLEGTARLARERAVADRSSVASISRRRAAPCARRATARIL